MNDHSIRREVVEAMVLGMLEGMKPAAGDSTTNEVFSAVLTLAGHVISVCLAHGANPDAIREGVTQLWEMVPPSTQKAN